MSPRSGARHMGRRIQVPRGSHPGLYDVAPFRGSAHRRVARSTFPGVHTPGYTMSPRFGTPRMEHAHGTFEAVPARSAARFFALCRTTRRIGRRFFKTEEFFAGWGNWIAVLADHLGSWEECAGGCGGANKIKDDNLKLEEQIRGRLKARRTTQNAIPRSSNHDDSTGKAWARPSVWAGPLRHPRWHRPRGGGGMLAAVLHRCTNARKSLQECQKVPRSATLRDPRLGVQGTTQVEHYSVDRR